MRIGNVEISSRLALAPMAGVTDVAFRQICSAAIPGRASRRGPDFWKRPRLHGGSRPNRSGGHRRRFH